MIKQYRKKPVAIEAVQWTGENFEEIADFMDCRHHDFEFEDFEFEDQASRFYIQTLEGIMEAKTGDYIIKGVKGEFYPCKPDVFEATYEDTSESSETDDEIERLAKENTELRQKAENNNACYISEAAWAERVGKYLIDFDRNGYSMLSRCMMIYIPEEKYKTLLEEYKALGHSLEG